MYPPMYFKFAVFHDFLCSVKLLIFHETASTLEHGLWDNLNLCSWAMVTHNDSRNTLFKMRTVDLTQTAILPNKWPQGQSTFLLKESARFELGTSTGLPFDHHPALPPEVEIT